MCKALVAETSKANAYTAPEKSFQQAKRYLDIVAKITSRALDHTVHL